MTYEKTTIYTKMILPNVPNVYVVTWGYMCAIISAASGIPQVVKTIRDKSSRDLSYGFLYLAITSLSGWTIYGFLLMDIPVIACNCFSLVLYIFLLCFKVYNERQNEHSYIPLAQVELS